jgi:hypothetical protein
VGRFKLVLETCGNPDHGQDPDQPLVPRETYTVNDLLEARQVAGEFIQRHALGGGNIKNMVMLEEGAPVARLSYNLRAWDPQNPGIEILDPGVESAQPEAERKAAPASTFTPLAEELGMDPMHVHDFEGQDFLCLIMDQRTFTDPLSRNQARAWRVELLLDAYREMVAPGGDKETVLSDFLADLFHYANCEPGVADHFDDVLARARSNFKAEQAEVGD